MKKNLTISIILTFATISCLEIKEEQIKSNPRIGHLNEFNPLQQKIKSQSNTVDTCLYLDYFNQIEKARIAYFNESFEKANELYKKAFTSIPFPLGEDLKTAVEVATKNNDSEFLYSISIILAKGGIPLEYFNRFSNHNWFKEFKTSYNSYQEYYHNHFNKNVRIKLFELRKIDSTYNEKYHSWRKGEIELSLEELTSTAKHTIYSFKSYVEQFGFPSEQILGYHFGDKNISSYPISVLLIHAFQRGEYLYIDEFEKLLCEGKLTPGIIAQVSSIKGFSNGTGIEQEMKIRYQKFKSE